jgi:TATA-box binding protein (TBP) (component of TFIID and TFIIIB)
MEKEPIINNVKAHIVVNQTCIKKIKEQLFLKETKTYHNYLVIRDKYTYIVFPKKGHINITGIKNIFEIDNVIDNFCEDFKLNRNLITNCLKIDNISAGGDFGKKLNVGAIQEKLNREKTEFTVKFDRNYFPGAFCKTFDVGTIIIFRSGKYVIVGAKCQEDVKKIFHMMLAHI